MSFRRLAAVVMIVLLAAPPMASVAGAAPQARSAGGFQVEVDPARACILAGQYSEFQGVIAPMEGVTRARLFFHSALSPEFYYVEGVLEGGRYVARLPPAGLDAGPITFYLEATKGDLHARSGDGTALVVRKIEDCPADRRVAAPGGGVSVFDVAGNPAFPAGFGSITGGAAAGGGVGAAAASGNFFTTTAGLITLGAVAVGLTTIVIVTKGNEPNSPSR